MPKVLTALIVGLGAGIAVAAVLYVQSTTPGPPVSVAVDHAMHFDPDAEANERIRALEVAVSNEREARQLLEEELLVLMEEIEQLKAPGASPSLQQRESPARVTRNAFGTDRSTRSSPQRRQDRLVAAGFAPDRAEWITKRESELRMESMQARFDARRSGEPIDPFTPALNPDARLRNELGEAEYEMYLQSNNRPTAIGVSGVLESSPAQSAGLQPGDVIVSYGGERVYSVFDLNQQTISGTPGESVVVDIVRDGVPMQVVMPRGPLGVTAGRGR